MVTQGPENRTLCHARSNECMHPIRPVLPG
jgi:hypothetical protein